jgi:hypothetical protein
VTGGGGRPGRCCASTCPRGPNRVR